VFSAGDPSPAGGVCPGSLRGAAVTQFLDLPRCGRAGLRFGRRKPNFINKNSAARTDNREPLSHHFGQQAKMLSSRTATSLYPNWESVAFETGDKFREFEITSRDRCLLLSPN
jgi:hypothetical protein